MNTETLLDIILGPHASVDEQRILRSLLPSIKRIMFVHAATSLINVGHTDAALHLLELATPTGENGQHGRSTEVGDTGSSGSGVGQVNGDGVPDTARESAGADEPDARRDDSAPRPVPRSRGDQAPGPTPQAIALGPFGHRP